MKNTGFLFLAFAIIFFSSCNDNKGNATKAAITKDTLLYRYITKIESAQNCSQSDTSCIGVKVTYPLFEGDSPGALNYTVKHELITLFKGPNFIDDVSKNQGKSWHYFLTDYVKQMRSTNKNAITPFNFTLYSKPIRQDSNLVTIETKGSYQSNGINGATTRFVNCEVNDEKVITLDDIFNSGYQEKLNAIAEKIFRKEENLKDTSSLARDYFFKNAKFALNDNFLITPTGIRFLYNTKEIKPAAAGTTDLFIPYSQITTLLKPNTVLAQYIKH